MAGPAVLRARDFQGNSRKIHLNDLVPAEIDGKRPSLQSRIDGGRPHLFLLVSVGNNEGFASETKTLKVLGKNPIPYVSGGILLGRNERLLMQPAGPGTGKLFFTKFELMGAKEAKEALQMLKGQG